MLMYDDTKDIFFYCNATFISLCYINTEEEDEPSLQSLTTDRYQLNYNGVDY